MLENDLIFDSYCILTQKGEAQCSAKALCKLLASSNWRMWGLIQRLLQNPAGELEARDSKGGGNGVCGCVCFVCSGMGGHPTCLLK